MPDGADSDLTRLLDEARRGNADDRDRLFATCRGYLDVVARAQVQSWLRAKVDASDLVQQTMLEAHRDFERFEGQTGGEWLAWLRRILSHNAADLVRRFRGTAKRAAQREVPLAAPVGHSSRMVPEPAARTETPSRQLARRDDELALVAALKSLPPDYREVIMLRNLQRLPFDEVARRMGRSRPAAQMLWTRAIKKLESQVAAGRGDSLAP